MVKGFKKFLKKVLLITILVFIVIVFPFELLFKVFAATFRLPAEEDYIYRKEIADFKKAINKIFEELKK